MATRVDDPVTVDAADAERPHSEPLSRRRRSVTPTSVLFVSSIGVFMAFIDATIVNIAFPDIRQSFPSADFGSLSWVLNSYNVVFAAFLVPAGRISDLLGRRRVFTFGTGLFTLASVACAVAPSLDLLIGARVVQAIGAAAMVPASLALVLQAYGTAKRAHAVALWASIGAVAAGLGPAGGGGLPEPGRRRLTVLLEPPVRLPAISFVQRPPGRR